MAVVGGFCLTFEKVLPKKQRQSTLAKWVRMVCGVPQRSIKIHAVSAGWGRSSWFMPVEHYCWITEPQLFMGKPPKLLLLLHNSRYKDCLWLLNCIRRQRIEKSLHTFILLTQKSCISFVSVLSFRVYHRLINCWSVSLQTAFPLDPFASSPNLRNLKHTMKILKG